MEKLATAAIAVGKLEQGFKGSVPMTCKGEGCFMAHTCPLLQAKITYMIKKPCPLEEHMIATYITKIIAALNLDSTNFIHNSMATEIATIEVYKYRLNNKMGFEDFIKQQVVGISDDGEAMYRDELHPSIAWDELLSKRKLKLFQELLATPRTIAAAGAGHSKDPSTNAAAIKRLLEKKQTEQAEIAELLKAEGAKPTTPSKE